MGQEALPSPRCGGGGGSDTEEKNTAVMVIVCGKVQGDKGCKGFVELWGGMMGKKLGTKGKSKQQRVQGALGGVLKELGFSAEEVFQI